LDQSASRASPLDTRALEKTPPRLGMGTGALERASKIKKYVDYVLIRLVSLPNYGDSEKTTGTDGSLLKFPLFHPML
jgi:hypothetical protein